MYFDTILISRRAKKACSIDSGLLTVGIIGAFSVLFLRPSKLKPSNHLCFWISLMPPRPKPNLSVGISLQRNGK